MTVWEVSFCTRHLKVAMLARRSLVRNARNHLRSFSGVAPTVRLPETRAFINNEVRQATQNAQKRINYTYCDFIYCF